MAKKMKFEHTGYGLIGFLRRLSSWLLFQIFGCWLFVVWVFFFGCYFIWLFCFWLVIFIRLTLFNFTAFRLAFGYTIVTFLFRGSVLIFRVFRFFILFLRWLFWFFAGLVTNSILFCWLFKIKDRCKKVRFLQTHNQGLRQLLLTVSWDLRA